jgi:putative N-acetyltransferase (TIGR04045 family)
MFEPIDPFRSADITFKLAFEAWELGGYFWLRSAVFCAEQGLFAGDDRDEIDARSLPIVAVAALAGMPDEIVGTVRIYEEARGTWYGGRLAVHPSYRHLGAIGPGLIHKAVATAYQRGCDRFFAYVQQRNTTLFRRLGWRELGTTTMLGRAHALMQADLGAYAAPREALAPSLSRAEVRAVGP